MSVKTVLDMAFAFEKSRVLLTACELDVFSVISAKAKSAPEIASELDTDTKATERLLDALVSIGLLEKRKEKYSNTNTAIRYLDKAKPEYMGLFKFHNYLWEQWGNLTEVVKTGKLPPFKEIKDLDEKEVKSFVDAVSWRASVLAHDIVRMIDVTNVTKVLDLGGTLGKYSIEFLNLKLGIKPYMFVYPNIVKYTKEYLKSEGYLNKIEILTGDFMVDDIGKGYDLVLLSFVMHKNNIWENIELCRKVYDSLNPGGQIVIQDYVVDDDRTSPEYNALLGIETLVSTKGGNVYTETDYWITLKEAWFNDVVRQDTEFGTTLMFGTKKHI
jgi:SAM-dependent methyltransferase